MNGLFLLCCLEVVLCIDVVQGIDALYGRFCGVYVLSLLLGLYVGWFVGVGGLLLCLECCIVHWLLFCIGQGILWLRCFVSGGLLAIVCGVLWLC